MYQIINCRLNVLNLICVIDDFQACSEMVVGEVNSANIKWFIGIFVGTPQQTVVQSINALPLYHIVWNTSRLFVYIISGKFALKRGDQWTWMGLVFFLYSSHKTTLILYFVQDGQLASRRILFWLLDNRLHARSLEF